MLAHALERNGIATVQLASIRSYPERLRPPRALYCEFPLGRPLGRPDEPDFQRRVLLAALALLERREGPVLEDFPERIEDEAAMAAVAERAGVTRRAVYLHFPSRAELIAALFDFVTESEGLSESTRPVWEAPDAVTALEEWARHVARFHPQVRAVTRAFEQVQRTDPDAAAHRARYLDEQLQACRRLISRLHAERRLAPGWTIETASAMLWSLISTDILDRLLDEHGWTPKRVADSYALLLRSAFVTDAPAGPPKGSPDDRTGESPA